jgi:hypothetical protein
LKRRYIRTNIKKQAAVASIPVKDHRRKYALKHKRHEAPNEMGTLKRRWVTWYIKQIEATENKKDNNLAACSRSMCTTVRAAIQGGHRGDVDPYVLLPAKL